MRENSMLLRELFRNKG